MTIAGVEGKPGVGMILLPSVDACWPANACKNRLQWKSMAEGLAKQFAEAACRKAMAAPQAQRGAAMPVGKFAAFIESLVLSALPLGNHGEIYAKGRSV